jgi:hypothetical protein
MNRDSFFDLDVHITNEIHPASFGRDLGFH